MQLLGSPIAIHTVCKSSVSFDHNYATYICITMPLTSHSAALPYAIDDGADIKYLKAGEESHVECPLYPGNPPGQIHWTKDGKDITELGDRLTTRDGGRKLLFCRAALNLSGEYNCFVDSDYPTYDDQSDRSQIVRIVVQSKPILSFMQHAHDYMYNVA